MLAKSIEDIKAKVKEYKQVYIYGAGAYAKFLTKVFESNGIKIDGYLVTPKDDNLYRSLPNIIEYADSFITDTDLIIIGVVEPEYVKQIKGILGDKTYMEIQPPLWNFFDVVQASAKSRNKGYFSSFKELEKYAENEGTDKSGYGHNYCNKYEFFLQPFKDKEITFVELGVFKGASIRMWRSFFNKAKVIGIDIDVKCKEYETEDIDIYIKDLGLEESVDFILAFKPTIVVDDASHMWSHQINALFKIYPMLPSGGIYIVEDICTSFFSGDSRYGDMDIPAYRILEVISKGVVSNSILDTEAEDVAEYMPYIREIIKTTEVVVNLTDSVILIKR